MNIYKCGPEDLARIEGIGPSLGTKIHQYVREKRYLNSLDDMLEIPGIGSARLKALKGELTLE
jgi:DNA uptake protein ComE-like DNA-binding protein